MKSIKEYGVIVLKGIAMGAADVVPGVSGGTIAFISGIYDELLASISAINLGLIAIFKTGGISKVWQTIHGNFLASLFSGIFISIVSLAKILSYLLEEKPILVWSFFFGLVLASIIYVAKQVSKWDLKTILGLFFGIISAYIITKISPSIVVEPTVFYLFLSGAIAICAMILPGISGSFILVLLGVYSFVLQAIHLRKLEVIFWVALGAIFGLLSFSKLLKYLLSTYRNITLAVLTGFIIGSLRKIWPWKQVLDQQLIEGKMIVLKDQNVWPTQVEQPQIFFAFLLAITGFLGIVLLEKWAIKNT